MSGSEEESNTNTAERGRNKSGSKGDSNFTGLLKAKEIASVVVTQDSAQTNQLAELKEALAAYLTSLKYPRLAGSVNAMGELTEDDFLKTELDIYCEVLFKRTVSKSKILVALLPPLK